MWKVQKSPHNKRVFETVLPERMELGPFFGTEHEAQEWCDIKNAKMVQDAAPDLLELARQIMLATEQGEGNIPGDIVAGARAAIAKATGGAA